MALNYSKWDKLELSDDSDFEPHPNVDKRSFIRAKQAQIHQQRFQRRHEIKTLKYERTVNDGLLSRVKKLVGVLQNSGSGSNLSDEQVYHAIMDLLGEFAQDEPPSRPEGVHSKEPEEPSYSKMLATLVDQVKKEVDEEKPENRKDEFVRKLLGHHEKIEGLQKELKVRLDELESEESRKITSDNIHTGFDSSFVNKADKKKSSTKKATKPAKSVEVPNSHALKGDQSSSSGAVVNPSVSESNPTKALNEPTDDDIDGDDGDDTMEASELGKQFAKIKIGNYQADLEFIGKHRELVSAREADGLLAEAFEAQLAGKDEYAQQCVHQAMILQFCGSLGKDGIGLFFQRVLTKGHKGQKIFHDEVLSTYSNLRTRCEEIKKRQMEQGAKDNEGVEQIQLHPVEPGTTINIIVPQPHSEEEVDREARKVFESFSPRLQKALESGSLDEVNKVLGDMSIPEAEDVVAKLGEGGMLSLQGQIIDATTDEGKQQWKEIEKQNASGRVEPVEDPTPDPE